jgi:hypothetical protein
MDTYSSPLLMIVMNLLMIVYTLWILSALKPIGAIGKPLGIGMVAWLLALHLGLSRQALFSEEISGPMFLAVIFTDVFAVGGLLVALTPLRKMLWELEQSQLLLLQGIRVCFGATFLLDASIGEIPRAFGILDGFTHIGAGFFGLVAAYSLAMGIHGERRAWFANLFGLADSLIVASTLALVLLPDLGPHHRMIYAVFLSAPLWLWFHLFSIAKLIREPRLSSVTSPRPA